MDRKPLTADCIWEPTDSIQRRHCSSHHKHPVTFTPSQAFLEPDILSHVHSTFGSQPSLISILPIAQRFHHVLFNLLCNGSTDSIFRVLTSPSKYLNDALWYPEGDIHTAGTGKDVLFPTGFQSDATEESGLSWIFSFWFSNLVKYP